jgi:hypothetical protein
VVSAVNADNKTVTEIKSTPDCVVNENLEKTKNGEPASSIIVSEAVSLPISESQSPPPSATQPDAFYMGYFKM